MLLEVDERNMFNVSFNISTRPQRRRDNFKPYFEPFRTFNKEEYKCHFRLGKKDTYPIIPFVSYQALTGGFTICNIILDGKLYSGSSHCSKVDQWLPIRGQMLAFKRALESTGITLPVNLPNGNSEF